MDTSKLAKEIQRAIDSLRKEQQEIDGKIAAMEDALRSLGEAAPAGRRGRVAKVVTTKNGRARKKPHWSAEARKAAAERMRKYWESQKASGGKKATKKKVTKKKATKKRAAKKAAAAAASE